MGFNHSKRSFTVSRGLNSITMVLYTPGQMTSYPSSPVKDGGLRFHFLGGGDEVGNVGCVLEDSAGTLLLIDYGFLPSNPPRYPDEAPVVADALFTHAHLDHFGMAPWLVAAHRTNLHVTPVVADLAEMLWRDSYKVSSIEGDPLPWDKRDLEEALGYLQSHPTGVWNDIGGWRWRSHIAGHVVGAVMYEIETPDRKILWTGDFDTRDSPTTRGAQPVQADVLFMEATYGGSDHPERAAEEQRFIDRVVEVVERGGTALVPVFANGRSQDVLTLLWKSKLKLNVHFDGMGQRVTKTFLENPEFVNDPKRLKEVFHWSKRVSSKSDRKKALSADVIVTTSGMLDGGPSIWYLNRLRNDPRNAILLTGYQAEGSGGRLLTETGRLQIFGKLTDIPLEVDRFALSNHAGQKQLLEFALATGAPDVILFHSDPDVRPTLAALLEKEGVRVHMPHNHESYTI